MTIDLRTMHKADSCDVLNNDSIWRGEERREHQRTEVNEVAYLSSCGTSTRCRVVNISADGAAIDVPYAAFVPDRFQLMTEADRLVRECQVVWIRQNRIGVAFEKESVVREPS
jgi:hypothetical protein